jgi:hypothetical protein
MMLQSLQRLVVRAGLVAFWQGTFVSTNRSNYTSTDSSVKVMVRGLVILGLLSLCVPLYATGTDEAERRTGKFLDAVDAGIAKLGGRLPQLRYWNRARNGYGTPGKVRGGWHIDYNTGVNADGGGRYADRLLGADACHVTIRIYARGEFDRMPDSGHNTAIYGADLGDTKVVARVVTAHPQSEQAEAAITEVIKATIVEFNARD